MNSLTAKFLATDSTLNQLNFISLEVGKQYYLEQVVIEYHSLYDYIVQVIAKTDEEVVLKEIYERHSDNCVYPGDWCTAEGNTVTIKKSEVEIGYMQDDMKIAFYEYA